MHLLLILEYFTRGRKSLQYIHTCSQCFDNRDCIIIIILLKKGEDRYY